MFVAAVVVAPADAQREPGFELTPVGSIGVLSGDPRLEFGRLVAVGVDDRTGIIFVLDYLNARLSAFSADGDRFLAATGRPGGGPGEFRWARTMTSVDTTILILDPGNLRLSHYVFSGDSLSLVRETRLPYPEAMDMCLVGESLVIFGYHEGFLLRRIDLEGTHERSFGQPFRRGHPLIEQGSAIGHVACDPDGRSVFVAALGTSVVRRYTADGDLLWESEIPGFVPTTMSVTGPGRVRYGSPPDREFPSLTVSLVVLPGGRLLVQFGEPTRGMGSPEDMIDVHSVLFRAADGAVLGTFDSETIPRIDHTSGSRAFSLGNDPFPRVAIYEVR